MSGVEQSGTNITPSHLTAWVTTGVIGDAGFSYANTYGRLQVSAPGLNFNAANTDNPINIALPAGFTRYRIALIIISGASAAINMATCGVFTAQSAGGTAVVTTGTAITVTATAGDTNNNMQSLPVNDQNTMFFIDATLYFRVQTAEGSSATANVNIFYEPLP